MVDAGSASSSKDESSERHRYGYDVFLSFKGEDARKDFLSHLFGALDQVGIKTYVDSEELPQERKVSDTRVEAIRSSKMAVVIFSENYARSRQCLYEVTEILKRMKTEGLRYMPIFYDVKPGDVRNQTGPYAEAFADHELNCKDEVDIWRMALHEASDFKGHVVTADKAESHLDNIVGGVLSELNLTWFQSPANLVAMESHLAAVDSLLNFETKDVQMVAICGMRGIGKTTIAKAIYSAYGCFFKYCAILENVGQTCRESSQKGLLKLQQRLLSQLREEAVKIWDVDEGADMIKQKCHDMEILFIIDDVNDKVQLEKLAGACDWFGPSSRIIVTTRDINVLYNREEIKLYEVPPLKGADAYQLFTRIAFQANDNTEAYEGIIAAAVQYAQGLPLAITILGGLFCRKPRNEWESTLQLLESYPLCEIDDRCSKLVELLPLLISCQSLVVHGFSELAELPLSPPSLESLVVDGCSELAEFGCPPLPSSLPGLDVDGCSELTMVTELPPLPRGLRRFDVNDYGEVAKLSLLPPCLKNLHVKGCNKLAKLPPLPPSLQILVIIRCINLAKLPLLPLSLQSLVVHACCLLVELPPLPPGLQSLVVNGCPMLVVLPPLPCNLQKLDLDGCKKLAKLPAFPLCLQSLDVKQCNELAELPPLPLSLQRMVVHGCHMLVELPQLPLNLQSVEVDGCSELARLPALPQILRSFVVNEHPNLVELSLLPPGLESLEVNSCCELNRLPLLLPSRQSLLVDVCSNLVELPSSAPRDAQWRGNSVLRLFWRYCLRHYSKCPWRVRVEIVNEFFVDKITSDELPPSIENLVALKELYFQKCRNIKTLPNTIYRLRNIRGVHLNGCSKLVEFPEYANGSKSSPSTSTQKPLSFPNGTYIDLRGCRLREINFVKDLDCVSTLKNFDISGNEVVTIPESISKLTALQQFNLENCKQLREILGLPPNLKYLFAKGCKSLEWYVPLSRMLTSHPTDSPQFRQIDFSGCNKLSQGDSSLANFFSMEDIIMDSQIKILHPGSEIPKWVHYKSMEGSISFSVNSELCQNIAGLAFCMVIGLEGRQHSKASFSCQIEVFINDRRTYGYMDSFKSLCSNHMWLMYVPSRMMCRWDTVMQDQHNEFKVLLDLSKGTVKCCGVHLVLKEDKQARELLEFSRLNYSKGRQAKKSSKFSRPNFGCLFTGKKILRWVWAISIITILAAFLMNIGHLVGEHKSSRPLPKGLNACVL